MANMTELDKKEIFSTIVTKLHKPQSKLVSSFFEDYIQTDNHKKIVINASPEHIAILDEFLLSCSIIAEKESETLTIKIA